MTANAMTFCQLNDRLDVWSRSYFKPSNRLCFERTRDWPLIKSIVTHEKIWPAISDDFSGIPEDWQPLQDESFFYLLVKDAEEVLGCFILHPDNGNKICWKVHTAFLPSSWGERIRRAGYLGHQWIFANTECRRIVTDVPIYNRIALRFAVKSGMKEYGMNPKSFMKNGTLHDVIMLGVSACQ
jgi:RimJ/RimL family protein N-acetyltransferase